MTPEQALEHLRALVNSVGAEYGSKVDQLMVAPMMNLMYQSLQTIESELKKDRKQEVKPDAVPV